MTRQQQKLALICGSLALLATASLSVGLLRPTHVHAAGQSAATTATPSASAPNAAKPAEPAAGAADASKLSATGTATAAKAAAQNAAAANSTSLALQGVGNFDAEARGKDMLNHLSAVIRYYRASVARIQTVGEPSDALYRDQSATQAAQIANDAFKSGRAEAVLLDGYQKLHGGAPEPPSAQGESKRMQALHDSTLARVTQLKTQQAAIDAQLDHAKPNQVAALTQQKNDVQGAMDLSLAMSDALGRIVSMSDQQGDAGFAGDIEGLQRSVPELANSGKNVAPPLESLDAQKSAGVTTRAAVLFQLLSTRHAIDQLIQDTKALHAQAIAVRTPLSNILRDTVQKGTQLSQSVVDEQTAAAAAAAAPAAKGKAPATPAPPPAQQNFAGITATFKAVSGVAVPLSQEVILLEQSEANLLAWRSAVNEEYHDVMRDLLWRVFFIALFLFLIFVLGEVWKRMTAKYVRDPRRRRQIMTLRRMVIGFLMTLVVIFGFVTQFNSLATFAGFITAGLAVGLQTILLSVAAYFFIIGRYGVRVGDRISVSGVSGDVIDVGLVRFYIMELAGTGTDLHPTGRVAVFSNSVLFQAGTPLYKQLPGTEYAWHELTVKLVSTANYNGAAEALLNAVRSVYDGYKANIEAQHQQLEAWTDSTVDPPVIASRIQLLTGGLQLFVRFPVEIRDGARVDQEVTQKVLSLMSGDETVKAAVTETPTIQSAVQG